MTVVIQLDSKPEETGWSLGCGAGYATTFPVVQTKDLSVEGNECTFTIKDSEETASRVAICQIFKGDSITDPDAFIMEGSVD